MLPYQVSVLSYEQDKEYRIFSDIKIGPLKKGQGLTLGNALRRTVFTELEGIAICGLSMRVKNDPPVNRESGGIFEGIREDLFEISLNLQNIVLKTDTLTEKRPLFCQGRISIQGPKVVTAQDILLPDNVQVVNPNQYICSIDSDAFCPVEMTLAIVSGTGYNLVDSNEKESSEDLTEKDLQENTRKTSKKKLADYLTSNVIAPTVIAPTEADLDYLIVDSIFAPVEAFSFKVDTVSLLDTELGINEAVFEYLSISLITNGSLTPSEAIENATLKLMDLILPLKDINLYFKNFFDSSSDSTQQLDANKNTVTPVSSKVNLQFNDIKSKSVERSSDDLESIYSFPIEKLKISKRIINSLKRSNINKIGEIVQVDPVTIKNIKNFGKKSFLELKIALNEFGIWLDSSIE